MTTMLIVAAVVVDLGYARQLRRTSQNSADAAALAAAQELDGRADQFSRAVTTAKTWAGRNLSNLNDAAWQSCIDATPLAYVPAGSAAGSCVSFDSPTTPTRVRVRVPTVESPMFFSRVIRNSGTGIAASAVARRVAAQGSAGPCGLCILRPSRLQIGSITQLRITGSNVYAHDLTVNASDSLPATQIQPLPLYYRNTNSSNWGRNVQPAPATFNSRYAALTADVPNPFAAVTVDYAGVSALQTNVNQCGNGNPLTPDRIYTQSVNLNCGTITLAPGIYFFSGTLNVGSGVTLTGTNVTLVFGCANSSRTVGQACNNSAGGNFNFASGSTVNLSAPTTGPYAGLAILFDPGNIAGTPSHFDGTTTLDGSVYSKQSGLTSGTSSSSLTAWTIVSGGNYDFNAGTIIIDATKGTTGGSSTPTYSLVG
jgi:hypothetical protein